MSEALDRGRDGLIRAAMRAVLVAMLIAPGCGGDDSMGAEPEPVDDASVDVAVRRDSTVDISPARDVNVEGAANLDRNAPPDQGASDTSANRNDAADASRDGRDAAPGDGGPGDTLNLRDTAPEAPLPEAQAEARPPDAGADAADDRQPSNDGTTDAPAEVAPVVEASNADAVDAATTSEPEMESSTGSDADAATPDAAEFDDGSEAGSSLAPQSWVVGSGPVCASGDPAECQDDPDTASFIVVEQASNPTLCAAFPGVAKLWFPSGDTLNPGSYDVVPVHSLDEANSVAAGHVIVMLGEASEATRWWGQMGTVVVTSNGGPPTITFDGVTANNGTTDALISGNVPCSP